MEGFLEQVRRVEAEFRRLKGQFAAGELSEAEVKAQLAQLMIEDEAGQWWMIGYETGQWYSHDGEQWVRREPPSPGGQVHTEEAAGPEVSSAPPATPSPMARRPWIWAAAGIRAGLIVVVVMAFLLLTDKIQPYSPTPTEEASETVTEEATEAATEEATETSSGDINLVMSFASSGVTEESLASGEQLAHMISDQTGYNVEVNVASSYADVIEEMGAGNVQMGWLNTFGYVLANRNYGVDVALAAVSFGSTTYKAQIIAGVDSGIESLEDLSGRIFCRPDSSSPSGWIIPSITLAAAGLDPEAMEIIDTGEHSSVVTAVYNGDCDAGATYVDARWDVEEDLPDVMEKVVVLQESADIPMETLSFAQEVPADVRENVVNALLEIAETEEGKAILEQAAVEGLEEVDDSYYDSFRAELDASGYSIEDLVQ